jgi:hypothetical protein
MTSAVIGRTGLRREMPPEVEPIEDFRFKARGQLVTM